MKKFVLASMIALASVTAMANTILEDVKISYVVRQAFIQEFGAVKNVNWQKAGEDILRANFNLDGEKISAFFNYEGNHLATTIQKELKDLPRKLEKAIVEQFGKRQPQELFELINEDDHAYFFVIEEDGKSQVYKAYSSGHINRFNLTIHK